MKIKHISIHQIKIPLKFSFKTAKTELNVRDTLIIMIENENGIMGFGEVVSFLTPFYSAETQEMSFDALYHHYIPKLLHHPLNHPFEIHELLKNEEIFPMAIAGLENALLDLYYKEKNQILMREIFKGEHFNDSIERGAVISDLGIEQTINEIEKVKKDGVRRIKIKVHPENAYKKMKQVMTLFPTLDFAVDANRSYKWSQLNEYKKLDKLALLCIEDPFDTQNISDYQNILKDLNTPVCFDENITSLFTLNKLCNVPGKKWVNLKIGRLGGLYQIREAINICRAHHVRFWVGSMVETGISKILHVQLSGLADNVMPGDLSDASHYFKEDLISPEIKFVNGKMKLPDGIGLGVSVNLERIKKYTIHSVNFDAKNV